MIRLVLLLIITTGMVNAKAFDCSVIYDEFDSLMHKEFLVSPDEYVSTINGEISFEDFKKLQRDTFYLRKDRPQRGIGVVFTNDKLYGKFIFHWSGPEQLMIEDIIIYNRVDDGYAPFHHGFISLKRGELVDLDAGRVYSDTTEEQIIRADLELSANDADNPVLRSINEARVVFPTSSICQ